MAETQHIYADRWQRIVRMVNTNAELNAKIWLVDDNVRIDLSDGRRICTPRTQLVSDETAIASAVQWARRHGAVSVTVAF